MSVVEGEPVSFCLAPLELRLFGPFCARVRGEPLPRLRSKAEWLLGLLALRSGRAVSRAWLAGTLWPDAEPPRARFYLRREISAVRQALGAEADRLRSPSIETVLLAVQGAWIDLVEFDAAAARGDEEALERAVALYQGDLLEGCLEEWLLPEREQRRAAYLAALERLAGLARARDDAAAAVRLLHQVTAADPLRESAYRGLMEALAEAGDHAAVLQVYRDLRLLLHRELNAEPAAETRALFERLRAAARPPGSPARVSTRARRQREAPRHNLPLLLTSFVGREREQAELRELLGAARLVTLTGAGGCGKTRLALRLASELVEQQPDGAWLVDLSALSDPELVLPEVARVLGAREQEGQSEAAGLQGFVRERRLLLVLDNCEHLLDACAALCGSLLAGSPGLRILATSRAPLGVTGEVAWRLPSLPTPEPARLPAAFGAEKRLAAALLDNPAVRLFYERAHLVRPEFRLTPENARAVAEVCHALDGIPLAIELAAARLRGMPVTRLSALLCEAMGARFRLLVSEERTRPARQQTLRAAMEWSFQLLSEPERRLLGALSVFAGGCSLDAAELVCSDDILELLYQLVDRSLVLYEEREEEGRYRLLETVREYAGQGLAEQEALRLRRRHAEYYLELAERALAGVDSPDQGAWVGRVEADLGNLRLALRSWEAEGGGAPLLRMVRGLHLFWKIQGHTAEGRTWMERAVAGAGAAPPELVARCTRGAALLARDQGDLGGARELLERAQALARAGGDLALAASILNDLGTQARDEGDHEAAHRFFEQARDANLALGQRLCVAMNLGNLGLAAAETGDWERAEPYLQEGLALVREEGRSDVEPGFLAALASVARGRGDPERAGRLAEEALTMARRHGNQTWEQDCLEVLARAAADRGSREEARDYLFQFLALAQRAGAPLVTARVLEGFAALLLTPEADPRSAALGTRLLAAAEAARGRARGPLSPVARAERDDRLAGARALLGDAPFEAAGNEGAAASLDQAVAALEAHGFTPQA